MATNYAELTPVEVDTFLADNYQEQFLQEARLHHYVQHLIRVQNSRHSLAELDDAVATVEQGREQLRALIAESAPYQAEFLARRWNRYFLVTNGNGHVHKDTACTTCFPTTQYAWLVDLADQPVADMIEEWGERACTVCFPDAPVDPNYSRPARVDREAQEARAAEKAQRQADKDAKAITNPDGTPLRGEFGIIQTKVSARNELSSAVKDLVFYGVDEARKTWIRTLVAALDFYQVNWTNVPANALKKAVKDSVVPPNNPFRLTPEQIAQQDADIQANVAEAKAFLEEVVA